MLAGHAVGGTEPKGALCTCMRFMAAPGPAISMAASMTDDSRNGAVHSTILLACVQTAHAHDGGTQITVVLSLHKSERCNSCLHHQHRMPGCKIPGSTSVQE